MSGTICRVRPGLVVAAALTAAAAAVAVAGSADAQSVGSASVVPAQADPGSTVTVTNGPSSPCTPPPGTRSPSASVDLYAAGSATPANRVPYQGAVKPAGGWSVQVRLAADLPPGPYQVRAGCYTDSGLNSGFGPAYEGRLEVRLQSLGPPTAAARFGRPGDAVQVGSAEAGCPPPAGAPAPRVRVSLLDSAGATRAESEGAVDLASGRWSIPVRVPSVNAQNAQIIAVCLARVGASAPYARYSSASFTIEGDRQDTPSTSPSTVGPPTPPVVTVPGASTTTVLGLPAASSLPDTPLATAISAEPTYTG